MPYDHQLTDDEKRELLRIARATLREHLRTGRIPPGKPHRESMLSEAGAFVTLHLHDELRGCIGHVEETKPLYKTIQEMAVAAASRDPRFPPLTAEELIDVDIEISVLGSRELITSESEIEIQTHGLIVEAGEQRGLLLPQVAVERGWDAETFLAQTCRKAGLHVDAWKSVDARITRFTAQVFSDDTHPPLQ